MLCRIVSFQGQLGVVTETDTNNNFLRPRSWFPKDAEVGDIVSVTRSSIVMIKHFEKKEATIDSEMKQALGENVSYKNGQISPESRKSARTAIEMLGELPSVKECLNSGEFRISSEDGFENKSNETVEDAQAPMAANVIQFRRRGE